MTSREDRVGWPVRTERLTTRLVTVDATALKSAPTSP